MKGFCKIIEGYNLIPDRITKEKLQKIYAQGDVLKIEYKNAKKRNLKTLHLYWVLMSYCAYNVPEQIEKLFSFELTKECWHEICKAKFKHDSVSFQNMDEETFLKYLNSCIEWLSLHIFHCNAEVLIEVINDHRN